MSDQHEQDPDNNHNVSRGVGDELIDEQIRIAREIGEELTDAFVAFVKGDVAFDDLVFGVFDALSDLNVVASGEYELEELGEEDNPDLEEE